MFDPHLRDKLLFEDSRFTYSRRYFWAYNTLGVINSGIAAMCTAYHTTFPKPFWAGTHPTLWPHPSPLSPAGQDYISRMDALRQELEAAVADLQITHDKNELTRTEIRSLREQLFSGSSVKESRRGVEQGDNIKILTSVSMVFLPLTFVVGVFGITTLDVRPTDWRFAVTLVAVCVPFFVLILVLQTPAVAGDFGRRVFFAFWGSVVSRARGLLSFFSSSARSPGGGFLPFFSSSFLSSRGGGSESCEDDGRGREKGRRVRGGGWPWRSWVGRQRERVAVEGLHRQEMERRSGRGWGRWPWRPAMVVDGNTSIV